MEKESFMPHITRELLASYLSWALDTDVKLISWTALSGGHHNNLLICTQDNNKKNTSLFDTKYVCSPSKCSISLIQIPMNTTTGPRYPFTPGPVFGGGKVNGIPPCRPLIFYPTKPYKGKTKGRKCCSFTAKTYGLKKLPPRDSNPDPTVQSRMSCH